ncbi:hypothetical protein B9479_004101 [Cryptococcus floricola]|uniref:BED-type domain-containing protein n=1 Tax=Cryptococcus floricola TaxID=2591691 RepID=A0A5D3AYE7_9TREE|nr:hypothetical protein B9479_004101 [Cryptococcus floricola]
MPAEGPTRKPRRSSTSFILPAINNIPQSATPAAMNGANKEGKDAKDPYTNLLVNYYDAAPLFWPEFKDPAQAPLQLKGCLPNGLLPCPLGPGWSIDVNDLLILHPDKIKGQKGYTEWKLITCRACGKTYDGKNGRSVARRHLQDKHGMPLAAQSRRSRWDWLKGMGDGDGEDMHGKKRKRPSTAPRMQAKLEKHYSAFLLNFGPAGLATSYGLTLIAPEFRPAPGEIPAPFTIHPQDAGRYKIKPAAREQWIDGSYGKVIVPEEIARAVGAIWDGIDFEYAPEDAPTEKAVKMEALEESARGQAENSAVESNHDKQPSHGNGKDAQGEPSSQARRQAQPQSHNASQKPLPRTSNSAEIPSTVPSSNPVARAEPDTPSTERSSIPPSGPIPARIPIVPIPPLPHEQASQPIAQPTPSTHTHAPEALPAAAPEAGPSVAQPRPNFSIKVKRLASDGQPVVTGPIPVSLRTSQSRSPAGPSQQIPPALVANQIPTSIHPIPNQFAPLGPAPLHSAEDWPTFVAGSQPLQGLPIGYRSFPQQPTPGHVLPNVAMPPDLGQPDDATRAMLFSQMQHSWDGSAGGREMGESFGQQMQMGQRPDM